MYNGKVLIVRMLYLANHYASLEEVCMRNDYVTGNVRDLKLGAKRREQSIQKVVRKLLR